MAAFCSRDKHESSSPSTGTCTFSLTNFPPPERLRKRSSSASNVATRWDEKAGLRTGCGVRSQVIDVLEAQIKRRPAMKKVSTAAAKQSKNFSQPRLTIGLD